MSNQSQSSRRMSSAAALATLSFAFAGALGAQEISPDPRRVHHSRPEPNFSSRPSIQTRHPLAFPLPLSPTTWINIGPAPDNGTPDEATLIDGRVNGIAAHPTLANTIYVAASGGGVWKTEDGGTTWRPLTDTQKTLAMGAIAIAPSDPNVLYAGTGEIDDGGNYGRGVLVSTDGGATWILQTNGSLFDRLSVSEIAIDPKDPKTAYVATNSANGMNTDSNKDDGVWKTANGGATWVNTTGTISGANWSSVRIDPNNPLTLYAAAGSQFGRASNGVYKTIDGGANWNKLTDTNLPSGTATGRTLVAVAKTNPANKNVVYVSASGTGKNGSAKANSLYKFVRSDDGGATFTDLTAGTPDYLNGQGFFDTTLIVDPADSAIVYAAGSSGANSVIRSIDSGANWTDIHGTSQNGANGPHVDHHASAFDASGKFLDGDDGGIFRYDPAAVAPNPAWTSINGNVSTFLLNSVAIRPTDVNTVLGAAQDNGVVRYSGTLDWAEVDCGDGKRVRFSPTLSTRAYNGCNGDSFFRRSDDSGAKWTTKVAGITDKDDNRSFFPIFAVDPTNGDRVVLGERHLWETTTGGDNWAQLGTFDFNATNVDALDVSPSDPNTIYASAGAHVFVTTDKGANWLTRDLPVRGMVPNIKISPTQNLRAVAVIGEFTAGGNVFQTIDGGKTWKSISGNLPNVPVWSVQFHGTSLRTLYAGADDGVYRTTDQGATWARFGAGLPNAQVFDVQLDTSLGVLAVATFGRGAWEIKLPPPTKTTVTAVMGLAGQQVTLKADVTPPGVPGQVIFEVNGAVLGPVTYDPATGHAELPYLIALAAGKYPIAADFVSLDELAGGNSGGVSELTVIATPPATTTTVPAVMGANNAQVILVADVKPLGVPGTVTFVINGDPVPGAATYDKATGHATQAYTITVRDGKHQITAAFTSSDLTLGGNSMGVGDLLVVPQVVP